MLAARYGFEGGMLRDGEQRGSSWWKDISHIMEGGELRGRWFEEHVSRMVVDETDTFLWIDPWVDGIPLNERFGRLFDLAETR
jgi:hypothetical protein